MELYYKFISSSATVLELILRPTTRSYHNLLVHSTRRVFSLIYPHISSNSCISNLLIDVHQKICKSLGRRYRKRRAKIEMFERNLTAQQKKIEESWSSSGVCFDDWALNIENRETLRRIVMLINEHTHFLREMPLSDKISGLNRLFKAQECEKFAWEENLLSNEDFFKELPDLAEFSKYAVAIYGCFLGRLNIKKYLKLLMNGLSNKQVFLKYTETSHEDLLYTRGNSEKYLPAHAIVKLKRKKAFLVIIRGTKSIFDVISDFHSMNSEFTANGISGFLHSGIYSSALKLSDKIKPVLLNYLKEHPDYNIILLGHSLGAGCAALLCLLWITDVHLNKFPIKAYCYAPPSVVSTELNQLLHGKVFSCVYGNDLVPRLSFKSVKDVCDLLTEMYKNQHSEYGSDRGYDKETLLPPGDIIQIFNKNKHPNCWEGNGKYDTELISSGIIKNSAYSKIKFTTRMMRDHFATSYEKSLKILSNSYCSKQMSS